MERLIMAINPSGKALYFSDQHFFLAPAAPPADSLGSLGLLALGAVGLQAWRARRAA